MRGAVSITRNAIGAATNSALAAMDLMLVMRFTSPLRAPGCGSHEKIVRSILASVPESTSRACAATQWLGASARS